MSNTNTGGPAFPRDYAHPLHGHNGMTLRDYFAAKAMQSFLTRGGGNFTACANDAYEMADAMLKARDAS
jgi:hypothetical protein